MLRIAKKGPIIAITIQFVDKIDDTKFHFHVYSSHDYLAEWVPLGLVAFDKNMESCEIELLDEDASTDIILELRKEVQLYFCDKPDDDHVSYMFYHIISYSNVYGRIHWNYIEQPGR